MRTKEHLKYKQARERIETLKGFYKHLTAYLVINFLLISYRFYRFSSRSTDAINEDFYNWIDWNVFGTAIFWGIGLAIHALYVYQFKFGFIKKWEQQKMEQFMNEEDTKTTIKF
ncbi:histidine kinase [Patiriisocius marinistellae]|uniref:Histidine kinase n=1 Tax=Patiriisocius marinistellae TaxID=2494560 RepID=A0A5J4FTP9_9FLAO|nr:2TM domain-containing protein [Patiriisocius marinistellae]GEQ85907.1 histidine kinase [Patiriisocius marinistellae]